MSCLIACALPNALRTPKIRSANSNKGSLEDGGEGSDATQTEELLVVAKGALTHLQTQQPELRPRRYLANGSAPSGTQLLGKCHVLVG
jgi:hypothetical protein